MNTDTNSSQTPQKNELHNGKVITRFPPSPTGPIHLGNVRTMLFNYIYATQNDGEMLVRFEDTDTARSKKEYEQFIVTGLAWLGITEYEEPLRQSERSLIYQTYLQKLLSDKLAYVSEEEPKEANQRSAVIRFKNPNQEITFNDLIRGEITVDTTDLGDFVIAKSLNEPLYHLAVVIDDYESGVTHVIRGQDHISNTPRQILIQKAIQAPIPQYAHLPMVLGPDKSKLSKRHGSTSLADLQDKGYLANAVFNYLILLGWHPSGGEEQEIFTPEELINLFNINEVQKSGAVFSEEKLRWINKQHLNLLSDGVFFNQIKSWLPAEITSLPDYQEDTLARLIPELRSRIEVYGDVIVMAESGELEFYFDDPGYFAKDLIWRKADQLETLEHLKWLVNQLTTVASDKWSDKDLGYIKDLIWPYAELKGKGNVLWPLRYALTGMDRSPDPLTMVYVLGQKLLLIA